jgi:hypothetical protein
MAHGALKYALRRRMANYIFVLAVGLAAGTLSGIIGTGASIMLLPVLVQVWRYQLPNPVNASDATAGIELHPHAYFVEGLLACDGEITGQEFILFISRARTHDELEKSVERIRAWRDFPPGDRSDIRQALYATDYPKIRRDHTYSMAFHHCDLLLERAQGKIYVHSDHIDELKRRLEAHKGVSEIIDFKDSEPDVIAFYGDRGCHDEDDQSGKSRPAQSNVFAPSSCACCANRSKRRGERFPGGSPARAGSGRGAAARQLCQGAFPLPAALCRHFSRTLAGWPASAWWRYSAPLLVTGSVATLSHDVQQKVFNVDNPPAR